MDGPIEPPLSDLDAKQRKDLLEYARQLKANPPTLDEIKDLMRAMKKAVDALQ